MSLTAIRATALVLLAQFQPVSSPPSDPAHEPRTVPGRILWMEDERWVGDGELADLVRGSAPEHRERAIVAAGRIGESADALRLLLTESQTEAASLATKLDALRYPGWLTDYLRNGMPMFPNWQPYAPNGADADAVAGFVASQTTPELTWKDVERFRELWPRDFVIKGIMHPEDAERAVALGADGIMVSNHGARQLDRAPSPLEVLPAIEATVGERTTLMLDSGVRRGADVLTALCLGAKFVFVGRPTLYGAAAGGTAGATKALDIFRREIDLVMGQIGVPTLDRLGPDFLMWERDLDQRLNRRP